MVKVITENVLAAAHAKRNVLPAQSQRQAALRKSAISASAAVHVQMPAPARLSRRTRQKLPKHQSMITRAFGYLPNSVTVFS